MNEELEEPLDEWAPPAEATEQEAEMLASLTAACGAYQRASWGLATDILGPDERDFSEVMDELNVLREV